MLRKITAKCYVVRKRLLTHDAKDVLNARCLMLDIGCLILDA